MFHKYLGTWKASFSHKAIVSVGAVGAAAPTDFMKDRFAPTDYEEI